MSDIDIENEVDRKLSDVVVEKEVLATGNCVSSNTMYDNIVIPNKTPGKEVSIKPCSSYRDIRIDSRKTSSTRSTFIPESLRESVKVEDNSSVIRSVHEIGKTFDNSPHMFQNTNSQSPQGYPYYPNPPPGYSYYPVYQPPQVQESKSSIPEYDKMSKENQEEARIIFRSKFISLKENYPDMTFDNYDYDLPLTLTHKLYEQYLKKISVETNSSFTRIILVVIFLGIEAFSIKVLNLDISGYTRNQIASMDRYDRLLLELGEKYSGGGGDWPIEARLFMLAIFNALLIVVVKFIGDKIGSKDTKWILETINGIIGGNVDSFVEKKPEPIIDKVTKTVEVPVDTGRNLMGGVKDLMTMANNTLGTKTNVDTDLATTIGNLGSTYLETNVKPKRSVKFGNKK